jgi:hypothetical protein
MKLGRLVFRCPKCELDRTKEMNPLSDVCPECGFNPMKEYGSREDFQKEKLEWLQKGSGKGEHKK